MGDILNSYKSNFPNNKKVSVSSNCNSPPINPSDINFYQGLYGLRKTEFPIVGFEGSGIVQEAD